MRVRSGICFFRVMQGNLVLPGHWAGSYFFRSTGLEIWFFRGIVPGISVSAVAVWKYSSVRALCRRSDYAGKMRAYGIVSGRIGINNICFAGLTDL